MTNKSRVKSRKSKRKVLRKRNTRRNKKTGGGVVDDTIYDTIYNTITDVAYYRAKIIPQEKEKLHEKFFQNILKTFSYNVSGMYNIKELNSVLKEIENIRKNNEKKNNIFELARLEEIIDNQIDSVTYYCNKIERASTYEQVKTFFEKCHGYYPDDPAATLREH